MSFIKHIPLFGVLLISTTLFAAEGERVTLDVPAGVRFELNLGTLFGCDNSASDGKLIAGAPWMHVVGNNLGGFTPREEVGEFAAVISCHGSETVVKPVFSSSTNGETMISAVREEHWKKIIRIVHLNVLIAPLPGH